MPIRITTGEFRFAPFRIVFQMSPIWDKMAREFADVATKVLEEEMKGIAREMGKEMLRNIRRFALPLSFTGRLADARIPARPGSTWRYWIGPAKGVGRRTGAGWYVTVGLHDPREVSPARGRPVEFYAHAVEFGGKPRYRLGKLARQRIVSWAAARGLTKAEAQRIAAAMHIHGSRARPYFAPAERATAQAAMGWLEEGGTDWRDKVEAHFAG